MVGYITKVTQAKISETASRFSFLFLTQGEISLCRFVMSKNRTLEGCSSCIRDLIRVMQAKSLRSVMWIGQEIDPW